MAQIANMLLKNYAAVDVTFAPDIVRTGEYAKYADRSQGSFLGTSYVSITRKINPSATGVRKVQLKLAVPTLDVVTGALKYTGLFTAEAAMPNGMTLAEKRELYSRAKTAIAHAVFQGAVENDDMPWG